MKDFQVGDELEHGRFRTQGRWVVGKVYCDCEGDTMLCVKVYPDANKLDWHWETMSRAYASENFHVKRTAAPESFRKVFCAWTGQTPTPKPIVAPLQQAKRALCDYVQRPDEISGCRFGELVDLIVEEAKAEALADGGVPVNVIGGRRFRDFNGEVVTEVTLGVRNDAVCQADLVCGQWRLVRVPA